MKSNFHLTIAVMLFTSVLQSLAVIRYVDQNNSSPALPYTTWATAATSIQDAVDAAEAGDEVLVTNGVYSTGARFVHPEQAANRVAITKPITVRSVNGPTATVIRGYQVPGTIFGASAVRCVYLANGAMLSGFTLTNGSTRDLVYQDSGGGVQCESTSAVVSNCVLIGNAAIYVGGGAYRGTLINCTLAFNSAPYGNTGGYGGGASGAVLNGCLVISNSAVAGGGGVISCVVNDSTLIGNVSGEGGGAATSTLTNCIVIGNRAAIGGGTYAGTVIASTISSNAASARGGGAYTTSIKYSTIKANAAPHGGGAYAGNLLSCVIAGNQAVGEPGIGEPQGNAGGGVNGVNATNCTITGNSAGGGGGAANSFLRNCIIYHNYAGKSYASDNASGGTLNYCCTTPQPASGVGNIVLEPLLLSASHLHANSPCRGAGNFASAVGTDVDGQPWSTPPAIGCDEYYSGSLTGALTVAIQSDYTAVGRSYPVKFTAQIAGRPAAIRWDFGDGLVVSNRAYVTHEWEAAGDYPVVLTAYNDAFPGGILATTLVQVVDQVHYVSLASIAPTPPYASWATAATDIQQAINVASVPGALVLVSNGVYSTGSIQLPENIPNRVTVTKPLILQSVNGPAVTTIRGSYSPTVRGVYLTNGAILKGFTIANGSTSTLGGGAATHQAGGGVYCESTHAIISNCIITNNRAGYQGGGVFYGTLNQCVVSNNTASFYGGGVVGSLVNNSLIVSNYAGTGGGAYYATLANSTIAANRAGSGGAVFGGAVRNSIIYFNLSSGVDSNYSTADLSFCCTMPLAAGLGNFTNNPNFVNLATRNFRLQSDSPCINSGHGPGPADFDLDGNPRIAGGVVDLGPYEFQSPASTISYAWLLRYGLPLNGSADFVDSDADGANNYHEWRADTIPTNSLSVLRMINVIKGAAGATISWQSVATRNYWLERAANLEGATSFGTIAANLSGAAGQKTFTDTTATNAGPYFYRVGVQ